MVFIIFEGKRQIEKSRCIKKYNIKTELTEMVVTVHTHMAQRENLWLAVVNLRMLQKAMNFLTI